MSPDPFSTTHLQISYRSDLGQLTGRWLSSVSEAELHDGYAAMRHAAEHYHCGRWLIDARRRISRSFNGPEWVATQLLPEAQQALGQPLRVCFLVLPDYLASLPSAAPRPSDGSLVQFARFVDEGAANAWLAEE
jgi:hypothetical protein